MKRIDLTYSVGQRNALRSDIRSVTIHAMQPQFKKKLTSSLYHAMVMSEVVSLRSTACKIYALSEK